jgi:hypothetical protein
MHVRQHLHPHELQENYMYLRWPKAPYKGKKTHQNRAFACATFRANLCGPKAVAKVLFKKKTFAWSKGGRKCYFYNNVFVSALSRHKHLHFLFCVLLNSEKK